MHYNPFCSPEWPTVYFGKYLWYYFRNSHSWCYCLRINKRSYQQPSAISFGELSLKTNGRLLVHATISYFHWILLTGNRDNIPSRDCFVVEMTGSSQVSLVFPSIAKWHTRKTVKELQFLIKFWRIFDNFLLAFYFNRPIKTWEL